MDDPKNIHELLTMLQPGHLVVLGGFYSPSETFTDRIQVFISHDIKVFCLSVDKSVIIPDTKESDDLHKVFCRIKERFDIEKSKDASWLSQELKKLAKELGLIVVLCVEIPASSEQQSPNLGNLRQLGSFEVDADVVLFMQDLEARSPYWIAKNRFGREGFITV
jgi:hypothetical protein